MCDSCHSLGYALTYLSFSTRQCMKEGKWWIRIFQVKGLVLLKGNKSTGVFQRPVSNPGWLDLVFLQNYQVGDKAASTV